MSDPFLPQRPVVTAYPKMPAAFAEAEVVAAYLSEKGLDAPCGSLYEEGLRKRIKKQDFDLLIAVGGDGTMLRAGHLCAPLGIPILGINLGRLGFLIQVQQNEWRDMLERLFSGEAWIEKRMMLQVEHLRAGEVIGSWQALNEAVVGRGQYLRPVKLAASADGHLLTTYIADGLIAATATGSTAYALAAGGPILPPELRNILIVPIAPHLSVDRAVVLAEGSSISIHVKSENAVLSVDGAVPTGLAEDDRVEVRAADYTAHFVRFGDAGYFYRNLTAHMNQNPAIGLPR
ncbi:MAG: NAD(+)/NADH kinase [Anaerolineales bacterium]|nr:NAD(+)/NADH kinase [Anaerolineales bacterium]